MNGRFNDLASMLKQFNAMADGLAGKYADIIDEEIKTTNEEEEKVVDKDDNSTKP